MVRCGGKRCGTLRTDSGFFLFVLLTLLILSNSNSVFAEDLSVPIQPLPPVCGDAAMNALAGYSEVVNWGLHPGNFPLGPAGGLAQGQKIVAYCNKLGYQASYLGTCNKLAEVDSILWRCKPGARIFVVCDNVGGGEAHIYCAGRLPNGPHCYGQAFEPAPGEKLTIFEMIPDRPPVPSRPNPDNIVPVSDRPEPLGSKKNVICCGGDRKLGPDRPKPASNKPMKPPPKADCPPKANCTALIVACGSRLKRIPSVRAGTNVGALFFLSHIDGLVADFAHNPRNTGMVARALRWWEHCLDWLDPYTYPSNENRILLPQGSNFEVPLLTPLR